MEEVLLLVDGRDTDRVDDMLSELNGISFFDDLKGFGMKLSSFDEEVILPSSPREAESLPYVLGSDNLDGEFWRDDAHEDPPAHPELRRCRGFSGIAGSFSS